MTQASSSKYLSITSPYHFRPTSRWLLILALNLLSPHVSYFPLRNGESTSSVAVPASFAPLKCSLERLDRLTFRQISSGTLEERKAESFFLCRTIHDHSMKSRFTSTVYHDLERVSNVDHQTAGDIGHIDPFPSVVECL